MTTAARPARLRLFARSIGCATLVAGAVLAGMPAGVAATGTALAAMSDLRLNFQPAGAPVPAGYAAEGGAAYSSAAGQGWVREDSVGSASPVPLDLSGNARDRDLVGDQRLDTFIHMQYPAAGAPAGAVTTPGAWELAVPSGAYRVSMSVGDAATAIDSINRINIEGKVAISGFRPTSTDHFMSATRTVDVSDGRLTIDARGGMNTKIDYVRVVDDSTSGRPSVTSINPGDAETDVPRDTSVAAEVHLPNVGSGVDEATVTASTARLVRNSDGAAVPANRNTTGGGDAIILQPTVALAANTVYRIEITSGLKDISGAAFLPYTTFFTTGTGMLGGGGAIDAQFAQVALPQAQDKPFTSLAMGPDDKLYAATADGFIYRFPLNVDGTTGTAQIISSVRTAAGGGARTILGLAFDPAATATNPILWITDNDPAFSDAADWTGKISRLSGSDLQTVREYVVGLPRSVRDHETNSLAFGPDGALYVTEGSNSAAGAPDIQWGLREEHVLNGAVLRVDKSAITAPPLNVQSEDGGTYDPFAAGAKVTIYASGVRNAFDLVWHSNGQLYVPTNASSAGGNTPATPATLPASCGKRVDVQTNGAYVGPSVPALTDTPLAQDDYLNRVVKGGYYGHPNDKRCEWVLNGGNPTADIDPNQVSAYPVGVQPDRNFRRSAYRFGVHYSPDGAVEYRSPTFGGALRGKLLVTRYSGGDDIIVLTPNSTTLDIQTGQTGIPGLGGFVDPLDLVEDRRNGNLYVSELGASRITLLRPASGTGTTEPKMATTPSRLIFNDVQGGAASSAKRVTIRNDGSAPLNVVSVAIGGADAAQFRLVSAPALPATIAAGATLDVQVAFAATSPGPKRATLTIAGNDPTHPQSSVALRGLGTRGLGGSNEPSLQWILDTYDIPIRAGDPDPSNNSLPSAPIIGDEVPLQQFSKAGAGPVTVEPLAIFGPQSSSGVTNLGWYPTATRARTTLFSVANEAYQSLDPVVSGSRSFDPGSGSFGLSTIWPAFSWEVFSEDARNAFDPALKHHVRAYPLKNSDGSIVANAYVVAFEEYTSAYDFQDLVFIVRNVNSATTTGAGRVAVTNLDGVPYADRVVFNRIGSLSSPPSNVVHDRASVRITNTASGPLTISSLTVSGAWSLSGAPTTPATIAGGAHIDVTLRFTAQSTNVHSGSLTIRSSDTTTPSTVVALAGWWQSVSEHDQEPSLVATVNTVFSYKTTLLHPGQTLIRQGRVETAGEEVLSAYWRRVDAGKPVGVRQLAALHVQGSTGTIGWHARGSTTLTSLFTHAGAEGQSFLPHLNGNPAFAAGSFSPAGSFGLKIDGEWSDDTKNAQTADINNGCVAPCGHHMRFWPARDRAGARIADTWLVTMDYSSINYDYNDNVYLISNMKPDWSGPVLHRLDVGATGTYTDTNGNLWKPDTGLFSPSSAPNQGANTAPLEIDRTIDDPIYRTHRGNIGSVPQAQRILRYALPTGGATSVDVRLHFAERYVGNNAAGRRLQDISLEGTLRRNDFDIFAATGGLNRAYVLAFNDVAVSGGTLELALKADADYPSVAGIEVFCRAGC